MLKKLLGSIVLVTLFFCSFNTKANVEVKVIKSQQVSVICLGIIEVVQIDRTEVSMNVNQQPTIIRLINGIGDIVYQSTVESTGLFTIDVSSYADGTYKLEAIYNGTTQTEIIVLV
jgi:hypothetical protein